MNDIEQQDQLSIADNGDTHTGQSHYCVPCNTHILLDHLHSGDPMGTSLLFMASAWNEPSSPDPRSGAGRAAPDPIAEDHPDRAVIEAIRAGDRAAFEAFYLRIYDRAWTFAVRFLHAADASEDIVHDVFLALWRRRAAWNPRGSIDAYLFAAIRNRALKQLRHDTVVARNIALGDPSATHGADWELIPADDERHRRLLAAIAVLPERQATALTLRWFHDMTYPEVAQILGVSPQAARTLVLRVETVLRDTLHDLME